MKLRSVHEFLPLQATEDTPVCLDHIGWHQCPPGWRCGPTARDYTLIHYIVDGQGTLTFKGTTRHLEAGQSFCIRDGAAAVYEADPLHPWSYMFFGLRGGGVPALLEKTVFSQGRYDTTLGDVPFCEAVYAAFDRLLGASRLGFLSIAYAYSLLDFFYRPLQGEPGLTRVQKGNPHVYIAREYIADHLYLDLSVEDLARRLGLNRSYLSALFKKEMGLSPRDYAMSLRLEQAQKLILDTDLPLAEVAIRSGFESYSSFFRAFRNKLHIAPAVYRKKAGLPPESR